MRVASRGLVTLVHYHQPILLCVLLVALCVTFFSWEGGEKAVVPSTSRHSYEMTSYGDLGEVIIEPLDAPQSRRRRRRRIQPQAKGPKPGNRGGRVVEEVLEGEDGGEAAMLPPPPPPPSRKQQRKQQLPSEQHEPVEVPAPLQPPQPCVESPPTTSFSSSSSPPPTLEEALAVLREAVASGALPGLRSTTVPTSSPTTTHEVRVDAALSAWAARQEAMLNGGVLPGDTSPPPPKFIAWKVTHRCEHMGLGNRLIGLISAMTLAFATGRGFIMAGDDAIVSAVLKPVGLDISQGSATRALERAGMGWSEEHLAWGLGMDSKCGCTDFLTATAPVFTMETTQYLVPCFTHNPYLRGVLAEALGPTTAAFRPMLKKFWALEPRLQDELERFARVLHPRPHPHPHPTTTTSSSGGSNNGGLVVGGVSGGAATPPSQPYRRRHVVGLQIRKGHFVRMQHEEATFYRCAKQLGHLAEMGLPGSSSGGGEGGELGEALDTLDAALLQAKVRAGEEGSQGGSGAAAGTASASAAAAEGGEVDVYYFLATDNGEVRSRARSILGEDRVITWSLSAEGKASGLGGESVAAVLDTWALSLCDDIILTYPKSTFGFVGSALSRSGAPPHAVISGARHSASCVRLTSTEPVFHGWFMRWYASCYSRKEWETPEMLNQENAYHCLMAPDASADYSTWGTHRCPASDESDGLLYISSPFDYEAVSEVGESETFLGDAKVSRGELLGRFQGPYEQFLARAGQPIYG